MLNKEKRFTLSYDFMGHSCAYEMRTFKECFLLISNLSRKGWKFNWLIKKDSELVACGRTF